MRILAALIIAVLSHAALLAMGPEWLLHQRPVAPRTEVTTIRLAARQPVCQPELPRKRHLRKVQREYYDGLLISADPESVLVLRMFFTDVRRLTIARALAIGLFLRLL